MLSFAARQNPKSEFGNPKQIQNPNGSETRFPVRRDSAREKRQRTGALQDLADLWQRFIDSFDLQHGTRIRAINPVAADVRRRISMLVHFPPPDVGGYGRRFMSRFS
jgi:hypothetical protein